MPNAGVNALVASTHVSAVTRPRGVETTTRPPVSSMEATAVCSNIRTPASTAAARNPRTYLPGLRSPPRSSR